MHSATGQSLWHNRTAPTPTSSRHPNIRIAKLHPTGSPNLLEPHNVAITTSDVTQPGGVRDVAWLHDPTVVPEGPLLFDWAAIEALADRPDSREAIVLDFYRQLATVDSLTLDQDPALAESWLRDVEIQYWDRGQASWLAHATLVFDSAAQTRGMPATPPTRKIRLVLPWGLVGNAAVRTVQVGGFFVGCSHPDIVAATVGNPVRVRLFDSRLEGEPGNANARLVGAGVIQDPAAALPGCAGYLVVSSPQTGGPPYAKPYEVIQVAGPGQLDTIEDWDFNIGPGGPVKPTQFRWIQFAWRALTPTVTGLTLRVGSPPEIREGWNIVVGDGSFTTVPRTDILVPPPDPGQWQQWHYVRVDLSQYPIVSGKPFPIEVQAMFLASVGGDIAFDQIVLAATIDDVPDPLGATPLLTLP